MNLQLEAAPMREMIKGFIRINQNVLNIPHLSTKQRNDLLKLGNELNDLDHEGDESKIKIELIEVFNRLN